ncbi:MAG: TetR/AcrR family transcriptional regulator [Promethearchaeota archaeon]
MKKLEKAISKKDKILNAALKIIAEKRNMNFTIREVVLDADVNVASINYYFGTKKKLIQEIENKFILNFLDFQKNLKNQQILPKERLQQWAVKLIDFLLKNPGLISIFTNKLILTDNFDAEIANIIKENNQILTKIIKEILKTADDQEIQLKIMRINADLFFPMLFIKNSKQIFGISVQNPDERYKYIESVINSILK